MTDIIQLILLIFIAWFLVTQKGEGFSRLLNRRRRLVLDSCALIDGRIVEIVNSRFLADELVVPQFIVNELQLLADGNDAHKRERARFGLDIAHQLQDSAPVPVTIDRTSLPEIAATDDKLVALARKLKAQLYTTDYNLAKVAAVEGVHVLNVNELAQSLRPITLPGETLRIKIVQKGSNHGQGVGYLEDGTMIVVDGAARFVGKQVPAVVTRMHQTVAGKMVFGQVRDDKQSSAASQIVQTPTNTSAPVPVKQQPMRPSRGATASEARLAQAIEAAEGKPRATEVQTQASTQHSKLQNRLAGRLRRRPRRVV